MAHRRVVVGMHGIGAPSARLRLVHRGVGLAHQRGVVRAVVGVAGDANAGRDEQRVLVHVERLADRLDHLVCDRDGVAARPQVAEDHEVLVAAESGDRVRRAHA